MVTTNGISAGREAAFHWLDVLNEYAPFTVTFFSKRVRAALNKGLTRIYWPTDQKEGRVRHMMQVNLDSDDSVNRVSEWFNSFKTLVARIDQERISEQNFVLSVRKTWFIN